MLFNSFDFAIFLPIVFGLYWLIGGQNYRWQNVLIVAASYLFYGWWDWRFLGLMLFSTCVDYFIALGMQRTENKRKILLWTSIIVNIGLLAFFKYFNFFVVSFSEAFTAFGIPFQPGTLEIILPVGISFYTFQTLSYSIDVYRRQLMPSKDFIAFTAFVSFFPQLVAGPIERASDLLPQFQKTRSYTYAAFSDGLRQVLWGLFKKVVIADYCAYHVNQIFESHASAYGITLIIGAVLFAFQIYCDFSGYSDIAIGTARLFGIQLKRNFAFPYFSRDIAEFWRRWHISLSTWFRDYVYIPLGGSKGSKGKVIRNVLVIFLVSGLWHGANWTFVVWGLVNALCFLPLILLARNRTHTEIVAESSSWPGLKEFLQILLTFSITCLDWVFFRAANLQEALTYLRGIFTNSLSKSALVDGLDTLLWDVGPAFLVILGSFILLEWRGRRSQYAIEHAFLKQHRALRWPFYYSLMLLIFFYAGNQQEFIYFQF